MKIVKYKILIKSDKKYFILGTILIHEYEGDIYYIPSQRAIIDSSRKIKKGVIKHISWHKSGRVHLKMKSGIRDILEYGKQEKKIKSNRQAIINIGFQEILRETILDITKLPLLIEKKESLDISLDSKLYKNPIQFIFSIVSGQLIAAQIKGKKTNIRIVKDEVNKRVLDNKRMCLGCKSDNADKLLQYILKKYTGKNNLKVNRRLFVQYDSKISRTISFKNLIK